MAKKTRRTSVSTASVSSRNEFDPDYTYVKRDLARIATLAVSFIVILIILSFVLN
jgi:hypothetical protein